MVIMSDDVTMMNGHRKLFHAPMKVTMAMAQTMFPDSGKYRLHSTRTGEAAAAMEDANHGATAAAAASDEFAMSIGEISRQAASSAELAREASVSRRSSTASTPPAPSTPTW